MLYMIEEFEKGTQCPIATFLKVMIKVCSSQMALLIF